MTPVTTIATATSTTTTTATTAIRCSVSTVTIDMTTAATTAITEIAAASTTTRYKLTSPHVVANPQARMVYSRHVLNCRMLSQPSLAESVINH